MCSTTVFLSILFLYSMLDCCLLLLKHIIHSTSVTLHVANWTFFISPLERSCYWTNEPETCFFHGTCWWDRLIPCYLERAIQKWPCLGLAWLGWFHLTVWVAFSEKQIGAISIDHGWVLARKSRKKQILSGPKQGLDQALLGAGSWKRPDSGPPERHTTWGIGCRCPARRSTWSQSVCRKILGDAASDAWSSVLCFIMPWSSPSRVHDATCTFAVRFSRFDRELVDILFGSCLHGPWSPGRRLPFQHRSTCDQGGPSACVAPLPKGRMNSRRLMSPVAPVDRTRGSSQQQVRTDRTLVVNYPGGWQGTLNRRSTTLASPPTLVVKGAPDGERVPWPSGKKEWVDQFEDPELVDAHGWNRIDLVNRGSSHVSFCDRWSHSSGSWLIHGNTVQIW